MKPLLIALVLLVLAALALWGAVVSLQSGECGDQPLCQAQGFRP